MNRKSILISVLKEGMETEDDLQKMLLPEEELASKMESLVEPYLEQRMKSGFLEGRLYYELFYLEHAKGTVVISFGYTESCRKYHEWIYYLLQSGYQCAIMDHRGHGRSVREGEGPNVVHVEQFDQYARDLHSFVHNIVKPVMLSGQDGKQDRKQAAAGGEKEGGKKEGSGLCLYAHSMGGCIGARYLELWPEDFEKAVLNAPMLGLKLGPCPSWAAALICDFCILFGKGKKKLFFHQDFQEEEPFEASSASSRQRHEYYQALRAKEPAFQTCCASYRWVREAVRAGRRACSRREARKVKASVLLFQAGEDTLVKERAQLRFLRRIAEGRPVRVEHSRHEIYRAGNEILGNYLCEVLSFYEQSRL